MAKATLDSGFLISYDWWAAFESLEADDFRAFLVALVERQRDGKPLPTFENPQLNIYARMIEPTIKRRIDGRIGADITNSGAGSGTGSGTGSGSKVKKSRVEKSKVEQAPPTPSPRGRASAEKDESFERFWAAYPKRQAKADAVKAWNKLNPSPELVDTIVTAVEKASRSENWLKDGGRFIPLPATYLNGQRWEDEFSKVQGVDPSICGSFDTDDMFQAALLRTKKGMGQ